MATVWELVSPFVFGGISGCTATAFVQPMDTLKVRIQVRGEQIGQGAKVSASPLGLIKEILLNEGPKGFYKGLGAAFLRQVTYATTRLGLYRAIDDSYKRNEKRSMKFGERILASSFAGFVGSLVGNPADVCLVRFQADSLNAPENRRNYKNVFDALARIVREEGLLTLWRGSTPTIIRAIAMNVSMLTTYDQIKDIIVSLHGKGKETKMDKLLASAAAGVGCAIASLPPDNLKTKLQRMKKDAQGNLPYKNLLDCFIKTIQREGVTGLWIGLPVFYTRVGPHAMITLLYWKTKALIQQFHMICHNLPVATNWLKNKPHQQQYLIEAFKIMALNDKKHIAKGDQKQEIVDQIQKLQTEPLEVDDEVPKREGLPDDDEQEFSFHKKGSTFGSLQKRQGKFVDNKLIQLDAKKKEKLIGVPIQFIIHKQVDSTNAFKWDPAEMASECRLILKFHKHLPVWIYFQEETQAQEWINLITIRGALIHCQNLNSNLEEISRSYVQKFTHQFCQTLDHFSVRYAEQKRRAAALALKNKTFLTQVDANIFKTVLRKKWFPQSMKQWRVFEQKVQMEDAERIRMEEIHKEKEEIKQKWLNAVQSKNIFQMQCGEIIKRLAAGWLEASENIMFKLKNKDLTYFVHFKSINIPINVKLIKPLLTLQILCQPNVTVQKLKINPLIGGQTQDNYYNWTFKEETFESQSPNKYTRRPCFMNISNVQPDYNLDIKFQDMVNAFADSETQQYRINFEYLFLHANQGRTFWLPLTLVQQKDNDKSQSLIFLEIEMHINPDYENFEQELNKGVEKDIVDPIYLGMIKVPDLNQETTKVAFQLLCKTQCTKSSVQMMAYSEFLGGVKMNVQLKIIRRMIESLCHNYLNQSNQEAVYKNMVEKTQLTIFGVKNIILQQSINEVLMRGIPIRYRNQMWFSMLNISFTQMQTILTTEYKIFLESRSKELIDGEVIRESVWYYIKLLREKQGAHKSIIQAVDLFMRSEDMRKQFPSEGFYLMLKNVLITYLLYMQHLKRTINPIFLNQVFTLCKKVLVMQNYHFAPMIQELFLLDNQEIENIYNSQMREWVKESNTFWLMIGLTNLLKEYPIEHNNYNILMEDCAHLTIFLKKHYNKLYTELFMLGINEQILLELYLNLCSDLFPSEMLYRTWDLIIYELLNTAKMYKDHSNVITSIIATLIIRLNDKVMYLSDHISFLAALKLEAYLINDFNEFMQQVQQTMKDIARAIKMERDEEGPLKMNKFDESQVKGHRIFDQLEEKRPKASQQIFMGKTYSRGRYSETEIVQPMETIPSSLIQETLEKIKLLKADVSMISEMKTRNLYLKAINWLELSDYWYQMIPDISYPLVEEVLQQILGICETLIVTEQFITYQLLKIANSFARSLVQFYINHPKETMKHERQKVLKQTIQQIKDQLSLLDDNVLYCNGIQYEVAMIGACISLCQVEDPKGRELAFSLIKAIIVSAIMLKAAEGLFSSLQDLAAFGIYMLYSKMHESNLKEIVTKCLFIEHLRWSVIKSIQQKPLRASEILHKVAQIYNEHIVNSTTWQVKYCWIKCFHEVMTQKLFISLQRIRLHVQMDDLEHYWEELINEKVIFPMYHKHDYVGIMNQQIEESSNPLFGIIQVELQNATILREFIYEGSDDLPALLMQTSHLASMDDQNSSEEIQYVQQKLQELQLSQMSAHFDQINILGRKILDSYMSIQYDAELYSKQTSKLSRNLNLIKSQLINLQALMYDYSRLLIKSKIWTLYLRDVTQNISEMIKVYHNQVPNRQEHEIIHFLKHISWEVNQLIKSYVLSNPQFPLIKQAWIQYLTKSIHKIENVLQDLNVQFDKTQLIEHIDGLLNAIDNTTVIQAKLVKFNKFIEKKIHQKLTLGSQLEIQIQLQCDQLDDIEYLLSDQVKAAWQLQKLIHSLEQNQLTNVSQLWSQNQIATLVSVSSKQFIISQQIHIIVDLLNQACQDVGIIQLIYKPLNGQELNPSSRQIVQYMREEIRLQFLMMIIRKQASSQIANQVESYDEQIVKLMSSEIQIFKNEFDQLLQQFESIFEVASESQQQQDSQIETQKDNPVQLFLNQLPSQLDLIIFKCSSIISQQRNIVNKFGKELNDCKQQCETLFNQSKENQSQSSHQQFIFDMYKSTMIDPTIIIQHCKELTPHKNVEIIIECIKQFLDEKSLLEIQQNLQDLQKKAKQQINKDLELPMISDSELSYITYKLNSLLDIDLNCIPYFILHMKQSIDQIRQLISNIQIKEEQDKPLQEVRVKHTLSIVSNSLRQEKQTILTDFFDVQQTLIEIQKYQELLAIQYRRAKQASDKISLIENSHIVNETFESSQNDLKAIIELLRRNYDRFIKLQFQMDGNFNSIEEVITKSVQRLEITKWDKQLMRRIYQIDKNAIVRKVQQLVPKLKFRDHSWRLKECEIYHLIIYQGMYSEGFGKKLILCRVLEIDPKLQKLMHSADLLKQIQSNLDQFWKKQSDSIQITIERQLVQLGLIQKQINQQQKESKRKDLVKQHKQLEEEIDAEIENVRGIADSLGITIAFLKDLKKQLINIQEQLTEVVQKIDEVGVDLKFLKGKSPRQLLELRMSNVLKAKSIDETRNVYVQLFSKEYDFDSQSETQIETPIFNTDLNDQGEVDEFLKNKMQSSFLIHGNAGCGKSTAAKKIEEYIWSLYQQREHTWNDETSPPLIPIFIQLASLKDPKFNAIQETLQQYKFDQKQINDFQELVQNGFVRVVFIMDSYDELNKEYIGQNLNISNKIIQWKCQNYIKVITSSRSEIFSKTEYREWFSVDKVNSRFFKEIRILPFDDQQRTEFFKQHCKLSVKEEIMEIYEMLCDQQTLKQDLSIVIQSTWDDIQSQTEFSDSNTLLNASQIQNIIKIVKKDLQIYEDQEKHLSQSLSKLWPIAYFETSIRLLGIQNLVESPYMTKIVLAVLPSLIKKFSTPEHLKPIFFQKFLTIKARQILSAQNIQNIQNQNEQQLFLNNDQAEDLQRKATLIWDELMDKKFFSQYTVTLQREDLEKILQQCNPSTLIQQNIHDILTVIENNKPVSFDFYELFYYKFVMKQFEKSNYTQWNIQIQDIFQYSRMLATQMMNEQLTQLTYQQKGIMQQSRKGDIYFQLFDNDAKHSEQKTLIRKLIPLKIRGNSYSFQHKSIQEFLFAQDFILLLDQLKQLLFYRSELLELGNQAKEQLFQQTDLHEMIKKTSMVENQEVAKEVLKLLEIVRIHNFNQKIWSYEFFIGANNFIIIKMKEDLDYIKVVRICVKLSKLGEAFTICSSNSLHLLRLIETNLCGEDLSGIIIKDISMRGMVLMNANLEYSKFENVDINGLNLSGANLKNCKWIDLITNQLPIIQTERNVLSIKYSSDGQHLASADGQQVIIYDSKTSDVVYQLDEKATSIIYFGKLLVCSGDERIAIYDNDYQIRKIIDELATCMNHSSNNKMIAWGNAQGELILYEDKINRIQAHEQTISALCFSSDSKFIFTGACEIKFWEIKTLQLKGVFQGHSLAIERLLVSQDLKYIFSYGLDNTIRKWDVKEFQELLQFEQPSSDDITYIRHSIDKKSILAGCSSGTIIFYDYKGKKLNDTRIGHKNKVVSISCSPDSKFIASAGLDNTIRIWDSKSNSKQQLIDNQNKTMIVQVVYCNDGKAMLSASRDGTVIRWESLSGREIDRIKFSTNHVGVCSHDQMIVYAHDNKIQIRRGPSQQIEGIIKCITTNGLQVAVGSENNISIWDLQNGSIKTYEAHDKSVTCLAFGNNNILVSGSTDTTVKVWVNLEEVAILQGHTSAINAVAVCKTIASGGRDKSIRIWDLQTYQIIHLINKAHFSAILSVAFNIDGSLMVSSSEDSTIKIWNENQPKQGIKGIGSKVTSVVFSPDSKFVLAGNFDNTLTLWNLVQSDEKERIQPKIQQPYLIIPNLKEETLYSQSLIENSVIKSRLGVDVLKVWTRK